MSVEAELQDAARQVLSDAGLPAPEDKTWAQVVELGWLLVTIPEDLGGLGEGLSAACAIYGELGRSLAGAPYAPAVLAIEAIRQSGIAEREGWLERLTAGEFIGVALAESDVSIAGGKINGTLSAVQSADKASHVLVCTDACIALVAVDAPGVERIYRETWDETRRLFDVKLANVALDEQLVLAKGEPAQKLATALSTHRDFALAADSVGGAIALLDMTVEYLKTRRQYGRPLALFQGLKHRCADLKALTAAAEALLLDSLSKIGKDDDLSTLDITGKAVKQLTCSVYAKVAEEAIQLHGGIAMTSEHICHHFVKRALLNEHLGGGEHYDLDIAASVLGSL